MRPLVIVLSLAALAWAAVAIYRIAPSVDSDYPPKAYRDADYPWGPLA